MKNGDVLLLRAFNPQFQQEEERIYELRDGVFVLVAVMPVGTYAHGILGYRRIILFKKDDGVSGYYEKIEPQKTT